jgi:AcrR family transcriptional regulator
VKSKDVRKHKGTYHHGDLYTSAIEVAYGEIDKNGSIDLTLRTIAEQIGVTHAALYHHFADRTALLAGVAEKGFQEVGVAMDRASDAATTPLERYRRMGLAYTKFALRHPRIYGVMFGPEATAHAGNRTLSYAASTVFYRIRTAILECQKAGSLAGGSPEEHTLFCWSAVHGFASIATEQQLSKIEGKLPPIDDLAEMIVRRIFTGLAPHRSGR